MPHRGAWAFPGADCTVLERAVERLGLEQLTLRQQSQGSQVIERHLAAPAQRIQVEPEPELFELPVPSWVQTRGDKPPKANVLPGFRLPGDTLRIIPATPAYYVFRRFAGDWNDIEWHLTEDLPVLRLVVEGNPVGLIALTIPGPEGSMETPMSAAAA